MNFPGTVRSSDTTLFKKLIFEVGFPERLHQLVDPFFQGGFSGCISLKAVFYLLPVPMI
jgi:hypothetical protein